MKIKTSGYFLEDETTGTPAPASAPATVVSEAPPATDSSAGSDVDWEQMSAPDLDTPDTPGASPVPEKPAAAPSTPAAPLPDTPVSTAPAAPAPVTPVAPVATPLVETAAPVQPPSAPTLDSAALRQAELTRLENSYAMDDESARMMTVQPEAVLPKLAAALHLNVVESVINTIMTRIPEVVRMVQQTEGVAQKNEQAFYSMWPQLNKPEHAATVYNAVAAYKHINPKASREEVMRAAGLQALISLRLPVPRELFEVEAPQQTHAPFQPAAPAGGARGGTTPPPSNQNPFAVIAEEFVSEDREHLN